jgi:hypothetical protein
VSGVPFTNCNLCLSLKVRFPVFFSILACFRVKGCCIYNASSFGVIMLVVTTFSYLIDLGNFIDFEGFSSEARSQCNINILKGLVSNGNPSLFLEVRFQYLVLFCGVFGASFCYMSTFENASIFGVVTAVVTTFSN